jgi:hypothetical protein
VRNLSAVSEQVEGPGDDIATAVRLLLEAVGSEQPPDATAPLVDEVLNALPSGTSEQGRERVLAAARRVQDLVENRRRRADELSVLHDIAVDLARVRDTDEVLEAIVQNAHSLIPSADATYLLLSAPGTGWSYVKASVGLQSESFMHIRVQDGHGMVARIYESGAPMWTRNYLESASFDHDTGVDSAIVADGLKSVLGIPLIVRDVPAGILYAANRFERAFSTQEVRVLQDLANLASIAIENAQSFEGLRETAREIHDDKTELERVAEFHADLTRLVIEGRELAEVLKAASGYFAGRLVLLDRDDHVLGNDEMTPISGDVVDVVHQSHRSGRLHSVDLGTEGWCHVAAVSAGNTYLGALVLEHAAELSELEARTLERVASIMSLLSLRRQAIVEAEEQVRGELLHEILESRGVPSEALRLRAATRGLPLEGQLLIAVAIRVPSARQLHARRTVSELARRIGGIGGEHNGVIAAIVPGPDAAEVSERIRHRLSDELTIPAIVCAAPATSGGDGGLADAFASARNCLRLLQVLEHRSRAATTREFALYSMLFAPGQETELRGFITDVLGALTGYDAEHNSDLVATLEAFYANGANISKTARQLYVHHNTIVKRLDRVAAILGPQWQEEPYALRLRVALHLRALASDSATDSAPSVWE